jgi:AraC family transcriptional regulator, transcriptional activator of the genes for pyochelin and ferripyochelin receptors
MTTDIIEINSFVVLIEQSNAEKTIIEKCGFAEDVIGFAFYGSGSVELEIIYGNKKRIFHNTSGMAMSFFGNHKVTCAHKISPNKPLQSISVFTKIENLNMLPKQESEVFAEYLHQLIHPQDDFVAGPHFYMTPDMQNAVHKILSNQYVGSTRMMFLKSQVTELLSHFFGLLAGVDTDEKGIKACDKEKLYHAKDILSKNIDAPPSLHELSKLIGLNSFKLKKNFKELFGVPVFKYLQNERLNKAHELLSSSDMSIQEAAWFVGYESLSSFSSAFLKKFGFRPSEIKK